MTKRPSDPHKRRLIKLDEQFREWVKRQPSAFSQRFSEYHDGVGFSVACHVRRSANAGVGMKPLFSCIALTDVEHKRTHQHGEEILAPPEWFETMAAKALHKWLSIIPPCDAQFVIDSGFGTTTR